MQNRLGSIIKQILAMETEGEFFGAKRFNALLDDLAPELVTERRVFRRAVTDEVLLMFRDIRGISGSARKYELMRTKKRLEEEYGLSESWSAIIVSGFSDAYGIEYEKAEQTAQPKTGEYRYIPEKERAVYKTAERNNVFVLNDISVFSSDGTVYGKKLESNVFFASETSYIGVRVFFDKKPYTRQAKFTWRIYKENGSPFSNDIDITLPVNDTSASVFHTWGWNTVGKWPLGRYRIVASINGGTPLEAWFEIKQGKHDTLPSPINRVRLFNGGDEAPPVREREYSSVFYSGAAKRIYFEAAIDKPGKELQVTIDCLIKDSGGKIIANFASPITVHADSTLCWVGYGSANVGFWKAGRYTYSVSVGNSLPYTGVFEVK